jgi:uncharacterized protein (DUF1810 family)
MADADAFELQRFLDAQAVTYDVALAELRAGRKRSHWMWFIFPQARELGRSAMALRYGIASVAEAHAYLAHPVLGARLVECTRAVLAVRDASLAGIFGSPDDVKFVSCMTLFALVAEPAEDVFAKAIHEKAAGGVDRATIALMEDG